MRTSIFAFVLFSTIGIFGVGFGVSFVQTRSVLLRFHEEQKASNATEKLRQLESSAMSWEGRQLSRVKDLGFHPQLIQGVMQPDTELGELRRHLDHVMWDGNLVQLSVLDFEGSRIYRRLVAPAANFDNEPFVTSIIDGDRDGFVRVHLVSGEPWVSIGAPVGRAGLPEGVVVATLPLSALHAELNINSSDGLELHLGDAVLVRSGIIDVSVSTLLGDSGLSIHYGPDLSALDLAIESVERSIALGMIATSAIAILFLGITTRKFLGVPLGRLIETIEGLEADDSSNDRVDAQPFQELDRLSKAFNGLLARLRASHDRLVTANGLLEIRVQKRTEELGARVKDLEQFAYVASHDLQEPLRKISSFSEILVSDCASQLDEDGHRYLGIVTNAALRMRTLIQDLLEFSRVGRDKCLLESVDLNIIAAGVREDLDQLALESDARIRIDPLPVVQGTRAYLTQLLTNLVTNAIKFRGDENPEIDIGAEVAEDECIIFVRDHGIGINPSHFKKVFGMFERLHSREEYVGTGIGLAICKRVVEELDGRIWLESTPGEGTTFFFSLKMAEEHLKEDPK